MGRTADGQVITRRWKAGRGYALRFLAYGRRHYLTRGLYDRGLGQQARRGEGFCLGPRRLACVRPAEARYSAISWSARRD